MDEPEEGLGEFFPSNEDLLRMYEAEGASLLKQCAYGTAESLYEQLSLLILLVLAVRIVKILPFPLLLKNAATIGLGIYAIRNHVPDQQLFTTVLLIAFSLSIFARILKTSSKGIIVTFIGILTIVLLEFYVEEVSVVRGILMILVMKLSSFAFDFSPKRTPGFFSTLAYVLDPATVIFGPFTRFQEYEERRFISIFEETKSLLRGAICFLVAVICVVYSSCHGQLIDVEAYLPEYFTAQSFRFSHYFICIFSQGLWTISSGNAGYVTNPLPIELPRSLVDVVVFWNVPMHQYLRKYIFGSTRGVYGSAFAVFLTFLVSSLLHGLNFQLSAVLISLGFLCYGENGSSLSLFQTFPALRNKLSSRLSACIRSRSCSACNHARKSRSLTSIVLNALFSLLSIYHLIYLGMPFDGNSSARHVFSIWSRHNYLSHWLGLLYIVLSWV